MVKYNSRLHRVEGNIFSGPATQKMMTRITQIQTKTHITLSSIYHRLKKQPTVSFSQNLAGLILVNITALDTPEICLLMTTHLFSLIVYTICSGSFVLCQSIVIPVLTLLTSIINRLSAPAVLFVGLLQFYKSSKFTFNSYRFKHVP